MSQSPPSPGAAAGTPEQLDQLPQWDKFEEGANKKGRRETTTAEDELQRFRHVPVVGRLPWRRQYLVVTITLIVAVLVLLQQTIVQIGEGASAGSQLTAELSLRQALAKIDIQAQAALSATGADSGALLTSVNEADSAVGHLAGATAELKTAWQPLRQAAQALPTATQAAVAISQSADHLDVFLQQQLPPLEDPVKRQQDPDMNAVLADFQRWSQASHDLAQMGRALTPRATQDRQDMEARLRAYFAHRGTDDRAQVWTSLLNLYGQTRDTMDQLLASQATWNKAADAAWVVKHGVTTVDAALANVKNPGEAMGQLHMGLWFSGLLSAVCLTLLIVIGLKQQRWQALQARVEAERMEVGIFDLGQQLHQVARGNLTAHSKVSDPAVGAVAESINHTLNQLRTLVLKIQGAVSRTTSVSTRAEQASSALAEDARRHVQALTSNSQDFVKMVRSLKSANQASDQIVALAEGILRAIDEGQESSDHATTTMQEIRDRTEDALNKVRRLGESEQQASEQALLALDLAERIDLLAVQADLHAARMGEGGARFAIVARGMRDLATQSADVAKRLQGLTETGRSEVEAIVQAIEAAAGKHDDLERLGDLSQSAWREVSEQSQRLVGQTGDLTQRIREQMPVAEGIDRRTQESLDMGEQTRQRVQDASHAVEELAQVVQELGGSVRRFQV